MDCIQAGFQLLAGALFLAQVHQHQVVVGAARHQLDAPGLQLGCHGLGILHDLPGVLLEFRLEGFAEADRLACNDMLQRAALGAGEDGGVDPLGQNRVVGEDQTAAGARRVLWVVVVTTSA